MPGLTFGVANGGGFVLTSVFNQVNQSPLVIILQTLVKAALPLDHSRWTQLNTQRSIIEVPVDFCEWKGGYES